MALEDSLDGALRRERSQLTTCQLQPDRLCTDPRETRAPRTVRFKFLADGEYLVNHVLRYGSMLPLRRSRSGAEARPSFSGKPLQPLGKPASTASHPVQDGLEAHPLVTKFNCVTPKRIFMLVQYHLALPGHKVWEDFTSCRSRSLPRIIHHVLRSRCDGGPQVYDVMAVTH
jgi:hypothetical protein